MLICPFLQLIRANLSQILDLGVKPDKYPAIDHTDGDEQICLTHQGDATMVAISVAPCEQSRALDSLVASRLSTQGRDLQFLNKDI